MTRNTRIVFIGVYLVFLIAAPVTYYFWQQANFRTFRIVRPNEIYRSGQLDRLGFEKIVHEQGIRTVISLREKDGPEDEANIWEERFCRRNDIKYERLPPLAWHNKRGQKGPVPADENVQKFVAFLRDEMKYQRPILIHCFAGMHRTGAFCAIYRMEFEHWTNAEAMEEMRRCGYTNLDYEDDVRDYIRLYCPTWKRTDAAVTRSKTDPLPQD